jgi:hypothetical protein
VQADFSDSRHPKQPEIKLAARWLLHEDNTRAALGRHSLLLYLVHQYVHQLPNDGSGKPAISSFWHLGFVRLHRFKRDDLHFSSTRRQRAPSSFTVSDFNAVKAQLSLEVIYLTNTMQYLVTGSTNLKDVVTSGTLLGALGGIAETIADIE